MDNLVRSDCHVTLQMLTEKVDVSVGTELTIVHERQRYQKVCAHCAPKRLTDQHKELNMGISLRRHFRCQEELNFLEYQQARCSRRLF